MFNENDLEDLIPFIGDKSIIFKAHNAGFERAIWREIMHKRFGYPNIPLSQWDCTAAKAAAYSLPRDLGGVGKALKLTKRKDEDGKRVMMKMARPRKPSKKDKSYWHYTADDFETLLKYCEDDVLSESAVDNDLKSLDQTERLVWMADQKINDRGVKLDIEAIKAACKLIEKYQDQLNAELAEITDGFVTTLNQTAKITDWLALHAGVQLPDLTADTVKETLERLDPTSDEYRVLEIRKEGSKSSVKKYPAMLRCVSNDGRVHELHLYWGANTGRWAGRYVQTQNLPRGKLTDKEGEPEGSAMEKAVLAIKDNNIDALRALGAPMDVLSSAIRGMLIADDGKDFIVADYAAIEARVLLWIAGDERALDIFRKGEDIYLDMAQDIYGRKLTKENKDERQMGKQAILGLGYQMGWQKFMDTCAKYGIMIEEDFAKTVVEVYRKKYAKNKMLWYGLEDAAVQAIETGQRVSYGKVSFQCDKKFLYAILPSGRRIAYREPWLEPSETPWGQVKQKIWHMGVNDKKQWVKMTTYGGKLTENVVQGIARDLLANAILNCERGAKYPIVFHVHDEIISEVPEGYGSVDEFEKLISTLPVWAKGLPLVAEGWRGKRYRK